MRGKSAGPLKLMDKQQKRAAETCHSRAEHCPRVWLRLVRQAAGLPLSCLTHRWESYDQPQHAGPRYHSEQMTSCRHTHTQTHTEGLASSYANIKRIFIRLSLIRLAGVLFPVFYNLLLVCIDGYNTLDCLIQVLHICWTSHLWVMLCGGRNHTTVGLVKCFLAVTLVILKMWFKE